MKKYILSMQREDGFVFSGIVYSNKKIKAGDKIKYYSKNYVKVLVVFSSISIKKRG